MSEIKKALTEAPVLKFYDPGKPVLVSVDASQHGMGACLLQEGHPIAYASRSLNKAERNYAQIEKEMLAIVFGTSKFHEYIYAKPNVNVETDHKPIECLYKKPLGSAPPRIQRMMTKIQNYDIQVKYKPGKELHIADALSRAPAIMYGKSCDKFEVHTISQKPISNEILDKIRNETKKDEILQLLQNTVKAGWPNQKSKNQLNEYWQYRDEITVQDGFLLKGDRIVIPSSLRKEMLSKIHSSHQGIESCRKRARESLFWPHMNSQIADIVSQCTTCNQYQRSQQKQPLKSHDVPDRPWQKVGVDLFHLYNENYVLLIDYYSKYVEISRLTGSTSSKCVIDVLKSQFARHGLPDIVFSDNGPQFSAAEFKQFAGDYGFTHITSSPHYPQSNGMAERAVQSIKQLLKKAKHDKRDPYLALLDYRNTPQGDAGSPAQRLMGRRTKTLLPTVPSLLKPKLPKNVKTHLKQQQNNQKNHFDQHAKPLLPLKPGDKVRVKIAHRHWDQGEVIRQTKDPRSYIVRVKGVNLRRNRRVIRKTNETFVENYDFGESVPLEQENNPEVNEDPVPQVDHPRTSRSGRRLKAKLPCTTCPSCA